VRNGVVVEEFGIGFPPRAWSKKLKNGVTFSLNWLPLGGFVKMQGEHDAATSAGDYGAASFWQKTKILLAGVVMNWLVAALLLTVLAWTGLPKILPNQFFVQSDTKVIKQPVEVVEVVSGSPADKAGLKVGDKLLRFAGEPVPTAESLTEQAEQYKGKHVEVVYERSHKEYVAHVQLNADNTNHKGYLGVGSGQQEQLKAGWSAPVVGAVTTAQFSWATLGGVKDLAVNTVRGVALRLSPNAAQREQAGQDLSAAAGSVAGPVGILGIIFPAAEQAGLTQLVFLTAIISLTLAVMNILPIPALDGGRWFTMAIFRLLHEPLTKEKEEAIQGAGFMALMILVVAVTIADVVKFF
jgi:regulator of sigma E protease